MEKSNSVPSAGHYDANYGNFQTELYAEIRREAFGEDIGQSSWPPAAEKARLLGLLALCQGTRLLDGACGSCLPADGVATETGCSVVGIDMHEDAVSTANSLAAHDGLSDRAEFRVANAAEPLPFPDAFFD